MLNSIEGRKREKMTKNSWDKQKDGNKWKDYGPKCNHINIHVTYVSQTSKGNDCQIGFFFEKKQGFFIYYTNSH